MRPWLVLAAGFVLGVFFCLLAGFLTEVRFGTGGYYSYGRVVLYANRMDSYTDYRISADHEWGHHIYQTRFEKGDLKVWLGIVDKCGYEGWNAEKYRARGVKIEEEFADSFAMVKGNVSVCFLKSEFLRKFG